MIDLKMYDVGASPYNEGFILRYEDGNVSLETYPPQISQSNSDIFHTVKEGETLQNIAFRYYKDSGLWYVIAEANKILNPFEELIAGTLIRIPNG